ncbi:MAG: hypothetical protein V1761_00390 [bacterium]
MNNFFRRVMNTEFLPMSEVRKIKVVLVMAFLLVITVATIPFSIFFENYDLVVKIVSLAVFGLGCILIFFLVKFNKIMTAIHVSIVYAIALTLFYTQGTAGFYVYLFFYISLTIIFFYQELLIFLTYGTTVLVLGGLYIGFNQDSLLAATDIPGSIYVYIAILVIFYAIFLMQSLHNEKMYTDLNLEWVKLNHVIESYQEMTFFHAEEIRKREGVSPLYEDLGFRRAVDEISVFVAEQLKEHGKEITNVLDLYIYIHERGLPKILENEEMSVATKKIANRLDKYLLNRRTDMVSILMNFYTRFQTSAFYRANRYEYNLSRLAPNYAEQVLALALVYHFLATEPTGIDEWGQAEKVMSHDEIAQLIGAPEMEEFLSDGQIAFFKDNAGLFQEYLGKKG